MPIEIIQPGKRTGKFEKAITQKSID